jgi:hypothetical protein
VTTESVLPDVFQPRRAPELIALGQLREALLVVSIRLIVSVDGCRGTTPHQLEAARIVTRTRT